MNVEMPGIVIIIISYCVWEWTIPTFMMGQARNNMRLHSEMKNI